MEDAVGLSRLSFWPKIKVSCANEETPSFVFIAGEAAEPRAAIRTSLRGDKGEVPGARAVFLNENPFPSSPSPRHCYPRTAGTTLPDSQHGVELFARAAPAQHLPGQAAPSLPLL